MIKDTHKWILTMEVTGFKKRKSVKKNDKKILRPLINISDRHSYQWITCLKNDKPT